MPDEPFAFGKNWRAFVDKHLTAERVEEAKQSLIKFARGYNFNGKTFLDIGCGSGLFSLCAHRLGAQVTSFDVDKDSVGCCEYLHELEARPASWQITHGSVLDETFLGTLGKFDFVYSWGVLHHTGDLWRAIGNAAGLVKDGGSLYIAIYNKADGFAFYDDGRFGPSSFWLLEKKLYCALPTPLQRAFDGCVMAAMIVLYCLTLQNPVRKIRGHKALRGMSWAIDIRDWLGGYPYEFASVAEVFNFLEPRGFELKNLISTNGLRNNEFLFRKIAMTAYRRLLETLSAEPRTWLITGVAGFIGSHLLEALLELGQRVVGLDNFSTGTPRNLDNVEARVGAKKWAGFSLCRGSVADIGVCREASDHVDYVLHQAGFVSVPLSIEDPVACHDTNVTGTLNMLVAARDNRVQRFVHASSSAVYGNSQSLPQAEEPLGRPLSPYGASKRMGELYARQFFEHYGLESIGLRYFNIFGPRQNPMGGYAAVIPQWIATLLRGEECVIHGDGTATRDFCHVKNVIQANLLAATEGSPSVAGDVFNVGLGRRTDLNTLYELISAEVAARVSGFTTRPPHHGPPRAGDILHSGADISRIERELGYVPEENLERGIEETVRWFCEQLRA